MRLIWQDLPVLSNLGFILSIFLQIRADQSNSYPLAGSNADRTINFEGRKTICRLHLTIFEVFFFLFKSPFIPIPFQEKVFFQMSLMNSRFTAINWMWQPSLKYVSSKMMNTHTEKSAGDWNVISPL